MFRESFFADLNGVDGEVLTVKVTAGMSILIPSMYLHFVYTPEDTIAYSCNFLSGCELQRFSDVYVDEVITSTFFYFCISAILVHVFQVVSCDYTCLMNLYINNFFISVYLQSYMSSR